MHKNAGLNPPKYSKANLHSFFTTKFTKKKCHRNKVVPTNALKMVAINFCDKNMSFFVCCNNAKFAFIFSAVRIGFSFPMLNSIYAQIASPTLFQISCLADMQYLFIYVKLNAKNICKYLFIVFYF
jgi:hypothetical protein